MNQRIDEIFLEKVDQLKASFIKSKRIYADTEKSNNLLHAGEFGGKREKLVRDFLKYFIPQRLDIGEGFIVNKFEKTSTQCDIIIYDKNSTPLIESSEHQRFFPIETVCSVGEVKSDLSKEEFRKALIKLADVKKIREEIRADNSFIFRGKSAPQGYSPEKHIYDGISTFLICNKFNFDIKNCLKEFDEIYENVLPHHRNNLVLSIEDGLILYKAPSGKSFMYPVFFEGEKLKVRLTKVGTDPYIHFRIFCSYIFMMTSSTMILYPELIEYILLPRTLKDEIIFDQE